MEVPLTFRAPGSGHDKDWVEVCLKLGAPVLRVFADTNIPPQKWQVVSGGAPRDVVEGWIADDLRECAEFAARHGIFIGVQNHGDFLTTGVEHVSLLKRVDHPNCCAIVDTGKYLTEDPSSDMAVAAPLAVKWQIKETPFGKPNKPLTDMRRIVRIARDANSNGYLPIESLPMGRTSVNCTTAGSETLPATSTCRTRTMFPSRTARNDRCQVAPPSVE